ncbi:hypothetical protein GGR56DRAFT_670786 [Xylariaceae sp. FL0804]|nr:hypothetical protein GGR56DRAFT_670786 [Xylariaceae sp. FL0804]
MPQLSAPLTLAATGSIIGSAWLSGGIFALGRCAIPAILASGDPAEGLARAWQIQFSRSLYIPAAAVAAAVNYLYIAQRHRAAGLEWRGYALGAAADALLLPYTAVFIISINNQLLDGASGAAPLSRETAAALIARWGSLSFWRVFMTARPGTAAEPGSAAYEAALGLQITRAVEGFVMGALLGGVVFAVTYYGARCVVRRLLESIRRHHPSYGLTSTVALGF